MQDKENNITSEDIMLSKNLGGDDNNSTPLNISPRQIIWGICIFDITTLQFYLGKIEEEPPKFTPKSQTSQINESNYSKLKS